MSLWLDAHAELLEDVASDLGGSTAGVGPWGSVQDGSALCAAKAASAGDVPGPGVPAAKLSLWAEVRAGGRAAPSVQVGASDERPVVGVGSGERVRVGSTVTRTSILEPIGQLAAVGRVSGPDAAVQGREAFGVVTASFRDHLCFGEALGWRFGRSAAGQEKVVG